MQNSDFCTATDKSESKYEFLSRVIWPTMISFVSISLFLFLSYMIIEGYSIVQMIRTDREMAVIEVIDNAR